MASYAYAGAVTYLGNSGTVSLFAPPNAGGTFDDGQAGTDFVAGSSSDGSLTFQGTLDVPLVAGGVATLPVANNAGSTVIFFPAGTSAADYNFPGSFNYSELNTADFPECFAEGTMIATPEGEVAVEALAIGDLICTADGGTTRVLWVGKQIVDTRFGPAEGRMPIRITQGALGGDLPRRDLVVTADHALMLDGLLINASALVNGGTISRVEPAAMGETFAVYHIETEAHEVILAEGCAAETFIDYNGRRKFQNYAEFEALYGAERLLLEMPLPRISSARLLPQVLKERLGIDAGVAAKVA